MSELKNTITDHLHRPYSTADASGFFLRDQNPLRKFPNASEIVQSKDWTVLFMRPDEGTSVHTTIAKQGKAKGEGGLEFSVQQFADTDTQAAQPLGVKSIREFKGTIAPVVCIRKGITYVFEEDKPLILPDITLDGQHVQIQYRSELKALVVLVHAKANFPAVTVSRQLINRKEREEAPIEISKKSTPVRKPVVELRQQPSVISADTPAVVRETQYEKPKPVDFSEMWKHVGSVRGLRYELDGSNRRGTGSMLVTQYDASHGLLRPAKRSYTDFTNLSKYEDPNVLFNAAHVQTHFHLAQFEAKRVYEENIQNPPLLFALFDDIKSYTKKPGGLFGFGRQNAPGIKPIASNDSIVWTNDPSTKALLFIRGAFNSAKPGNHMGMLASKDGYYGLSWYVAEWELIEFNDLQIAKRVFRLLRSRGDNLQDVVSQLVTGEYSKYYEKNFSEQYQAVFADCTTTGSNGDQILSMP